MITPPHLSPEHSRTAGRLAATPLISHGMQVLKTWADVEEARGVLRAWNTSLVDGVAIPGRGTLAVGDVKKSWDILKSILLIEKNYTKDAAILDLGTFNSEILGILHSRGWRNLSGIDLNPNVGLMPYADSIRYLSGDYHDSRLPNQSFDVITAISVIEHGFDASRLLTEISRLLKPGGCFIASVDYWDPKISTEGKTAYGMDWRIFSAQELRNFFRMAEAYDFYIPGGMEFETRDATIEWNEKNYTFAWFVLEKKIQEPKTSAPPAPLNDLPLQSSGKTPKKGRLAFLSTFNQACGLATHTAAMLGSIRNSPEFQNHFSDEILVLSEDTNSHFRNDPNFVKRCWRKRDEDFSSAHAIILNEKISVLHIQFHGAQFIATGLLEFLNSLVQHGVRVVITVHSMETYLPFAAQVSSIADRTFVFLSQAIPRLVAFGADARKIRVIPHGIASSHTHQPLTQARTAARIPSNITLVTSFGFLRPHKGVLEIIQSLPEVIRLVPNLFFLFIGGGHPDSPADEMYYRQCRDLVQRLDIERHVDFIYGFIPDEEASRFLSASDAIVLNYLQNRNEISGAGSFALAHRRPVITTGTPAFSPIRSCTLQTSVDLNLTDALILVLKQKGLADYLCHQGDVYIKENSYEQVAKLLIEEYVIIPS